jgi:molecular chaperone GrpE
MSKTSHNYILSQEQRDKLVEKLETLEKEKVSLQQSLREQQTQSTATIEDLFLELLSVGDGLEALLDYLEKNPDLTPEFIQRLPRSIGAVHRKFLNVLKKRQVFPIELEGTQPDFNLCRVVEREIRTDLEDQTITKIVLGGFRCGEKILRPAEVITSITE